jgi:hypothetical protein
MAIQNADIYGPTAIQLPDGTTIIGPAPAAPSAPASSGKKLNFLGWGVLLLGLYAINGTSMGHEVIFYSMVLIIIFLFTYNYKRIMPILTK